jgi:hypothetical protein
MSKKSRKRNKKILAALALAGGAALMARRGKGTSAVTGVVNPNAPKTKWITEKTDTAPAVVADTAPKHIVNRTRNKIIYSDGSVDTPGTIYQKNKLSAGNKVPPSMRGGLKHAEGYQREIPGRQHYPGGWEGGYSMRAKGGRIGAKKGGRVTGIAKRGFGRALMKGKK